MPSIPEELTDPFASLAANSTMIESQAAPIEPETPLLASLPDFRVFGRLFDVTFLLSALFTAAYRYVSSRVDADEIHSF